MVIATHSQISKGYSIAFLSALILSTTAIFIRYLTNAYHMPALVLAFWRDAFVILTLLPVLSALRPDLLRIKSSQSLFLIIYGFLLALFNALWTLSIAFNGAAIATVLVYSSAAFTAILGNWFLKEGLGLVKFIAIAFSFLGCAMVSSALNIQEWNTNPTGILTGILSGLLYAIYSLMGRSASQRGLNAWTTLFYTFTFATFFLFCFNLPSGAGLPGAASHLSELNWLGSAWMGWLILFLLSAGPTILGYGLYNISLTLLPSSVANLILTLEPPFTAAIAFVLFGEILSGNQVIGSAFILFGVIFLRIFGHEGIIFKSKVGD